MKSPNILFLITAVICLIYLAFAAIKGMEYDSTFWVALLTIFFSGGAWLLARKKEGK